MSLDFESMQSMENLNNANSGIKIKEYKKPSEVRKLRGATSLDIVSTLY